MKYQIEEYKDHFKIAEQITVPFAVTPKWYQFWKSVTTTEHEVWVHVRIRVKTKEEAQKHIEKLINQPKVKYPIIHEVETPVPSQPIDSAEPTDQQIKATFIKTK
tara:strand:- start:6083 stop:6397 length:315 start_codon:yes stop_codon:yes gene_type:complete